MAAHYTQNWQPHLGQSAPPLFVGIEDFAQIRKGRPPFAYWRYL
jgi:hypothetical protein